MADLASALIGGIVGGALAPILLNEYRSWRRERRWAEPRKKHLRDLLRRKRFPISSLKTLARTIGAQDEECRTLLMDLGARGVKMKDDKEGWTLRPLSEANIDEALDDPETNPAEPKA